MENCPNCSEELTSKMFGSNELLEDAKVAIINEYSEKLKAYYCDSCGDELYKNCKLKYDREKNRTSSDLKKLIQSIPVISAHQPKGWDYQVLGMVTGQSTTGTGVFSEFTSSFADLFGAQSEQHNKKLRKGENMCFAQLQKQALDLGGNAIIATDIDYSEIGELKGMLMVCMAGTAVKLNNVDILAADKKKAIGTLNEKNNRLNYLNYLVS